MQTLKAGFSNQHLFAVVAVAIGTLVLSIIHIHNDFPLILGDSRRYILRAHRLVESSHWSNTYTFFIAVILKIFGTVQFVAVFQNLLTSLTLYIFIKNTLKKFRHYQFVGIILILMLTALPWVSTMIMSDIFTPICLLGITLLLNKPISKIELVILLILLFAGLSAHQSHLLIMPVFATIILLVKWIFGRMENKKRVLTNYILILVVLFLSNIFEKNIFNRPIASKQETSTNSTFKKADISTGYHFVAFRIRESGQLRKILKDFCSDDQDNYLCEYAYTSDTIRIKNVGYDKRNENNELYVKYASDNKEIVLYSLKKPAFYYGMIGLVGKRGFSLLSRTMIRKYNTLKESGNNSLIKLLNKVNPADAWAYRNSKQIHGFYRKFIRDYYPIFKLTWWVFFIPATLILYIFLSLRNKKLVKLDPTVSYTVLCLVFGHVLNCIMCGTFSSNMNLRYSSRTLWLVNLAVLLLLMSLWTLYKERKSRLVSENV